jgi:H+-transporting ATPase
MNLSRFSHFTHLISQVSISGQALVFVVRHQGWSLIQRAGVMTYLAFLLAQIGATIIALFGFNGYEHPKDGYHDCQFCRLSTGGPVSFHIF